ncbi:MAG: NUDIX hydrolase [Solirubrobacterales bacterium]
MERSDLDHDHGAEVLAAGGVVVRGQGAARLVAVIHRPKYGDWTLPKGKLEPGEGFEDAALREVAEETGLRCKLGDELSRVGYRDRRGRSKLVRYWRMDPGGGSFAPNREVDELRWLDGDAAVSLLSYPHDAELVREALSLSP